MGADMNKRQANKLCAALNGVIHSRNLYRNGRRLYNAQVCVTDCRIEIRVEDLYSGNQSEFVNDGSFVDGYGQPVIL